MQKIFDQPQTYMFKFLKELSAKHWLKRKKKNYDKNTKFKCFTGLDEYHFPSLKVYYCSFSSTVNLFILS